MAREVTGITVLDGNRFYVADPAGDAGSGEQGLYADDVRVLSRWGVTVDGRALQPLGRSAGQSVVTGYGQVPAPGRPGAPPVTSRRRLAVSQAGLGETLTLTNQSPRPVTVIVRYEFAADFADLFEVKEQQLGAAEFPARGLPPLSSSRRFLDTGWLLTAGTPGFAVGVRIDFDPDPTDRAPAWTSGSVFYEVTLPGGGAWTVRAAVLLLGAAGTAQPDPAGALAAAEAETAARQIRWTSSVPGLTADWTALGATYRQSVADLGALHMTGGGGVLPAAGLPWFMTIFGRDTLITCLQTLVLGQDPARAALRALARLQSTMDDPERDAEPGKIVHEVRVGKVARLGNSLPYYGSVDATPLFVMLAVETWRWTGDDALVRELEPALRAALSWMDGPADLTGRGYLEFHRRSSAGLETQSWKDSFNAMLFADGRRARTPIAAAEVQGYAYAARLGLAELARRVWTDGPLADRLVADAEALKNRFHNDFWTGTHYALALDRDGAQVDSLTSNTGHLLWTGIAAEPAVDSTAAGLLSPDLFTGWGVRTMSRRDAGYHPVEYHDGTVWPHDTSLAALGLARVGRYADAATLLRGLVDAAEQLGYRLPEVLAGYDRAETGVPLVYPTTCSPQAWASAAPVAALTAVLGLTPDPATRTLTARGDPPADLAVTLNGIPAFDRRWTVTAADGAVSVTPDSPGGR
jgi:glycogen debranching enzyme